jgi:hypothetical protein
MANFDLSKYATVDERIADFYRDFPEGSIRTRMAVRDGDEVIFEARVYRTREDVALGVYASGWAREVENKSPVNRTSHLENSETSSIGRALANLGYSGNINGKRAPRPSREEMEKANRPPPAPKEERYKARIRELAVEVDTLREAKAVDLTLRPAAAEAEEFLVTPDCNTALMEKYGNKLGQERDRLASLPDPTPGYENYQAPSLEDASDSLPFA